GAHRARGRLHARRGQGGVIRFRSVVGRTIALHLVAIAVTSICMPLALYLMLKNAAEDLHDRALREQASEILRHVTLAADGALQLKLPGPLAELYSEAYGRYAFAVLDETGAVMFSSLSNHRAIAGLGPAGHEIAYFTRR